MRVAGTTSKTRRWATCLAGTWKNFTNSSISPCNGFARNPGWSVLSLLKRDWLWIDCYPYRAAVSIRSVDFERWRIDSQHDSKRRFGHRLDPGLDGAEGVRDLVDLAATVSKRWGAYFAFLAS